MKRMTKKLYGILILSMLATSAHAGWLSNLGQRIVNGAANTVQTNISGKVNKTINDVMDGKLAPQQKNSKSPGDNIEGYPGAPTPGVSAGGPAPIYGTEATEGLNKISSTNQHGRAIPYKDKFEQIDLGITKFVGERIYDQMLKVGERKLDIDEFLNPGYYVVWIDSGSRTNEIHVIYEHEREGIGFGYGIVERKKIFNNGPRNMRGDKEGIMYVVEVLPNTQGHLELTLINSQNLMGNGTITIFKILGPTLK